MPGHASPVVEGALSAFASPAEAVKRTGGAGACLARGMGAGLIAGIVSGLFLLAVGEPSLDEAIRLEHAAASSAEPHAEEVFTRDQQHMGMVLASGLYGVALGGALGIIYFASSRRMSGSAWNRSMRIALTGFGAFFLIPFLKYPASPPGVGDPDTFATRTAAYLTLVAVAVGAALVGVWVSRRLRASGAAAHRRHLVVGAGYLLVVAAAFVLLPPGEIPEGIPAGLIWDFRVASVGGQAILWTGTGAVLGLLSLRAEKRAGLAGAPRSVTE